MTISRDQNYNLLGYENGFFLNLTKEGTASHYLIIDFPLLKPRDNLREWSDEHFSCFYSLWNKQ